MGEAMKKGAQNYVSAVYQCGTNPLAQCIYQHSYFGTVRISHPGLLLEVSPHNVEVPSIVCLLPSCYGKGSMLLRALICLEIVAILFVCLVL